VLSSSAFIACRMAALGLAEALDKVSGSKADRLGKAAFSSMIFVAETSTLASSRLSQVMSIFWGIVCILWGAGAMLTQAPNSGIVSGIEASYSHFRYTNLADR